MDAELFKQALASSKDTSTNPPAPTAPAWQTGAAPPPSSDPFADLFTKQPPGPTLPSRQDNNPWSSQAREYGQGPSNTEMSPQAFMMSSLNRLSMLGESPKPNFNGAAMGGGGAHDNLEELMQKFTGLMVQAGGLVGEPPAMSMVRAQRQMQRWSWTPPPMGRVQLVQGIARLERELGSGGSGLSGGLDRLGAGLDDDWDW